MQLLTSIAALAAILLPTILAGNAPNTTDNPDGAQYIAKFPKGNAVSGSVVVSSTSTGIGVNVDVSISGLPAQGGPFLYHIHSLPVNSDGNCSSTDGHLDPYVAGEDVPCNPREPASCQVGDLSGKHGKMPGPDYSASYKDPFVSTLVGEPAFVGNRSLVVHYANKTIITCANFTSAGKPSKPSGASSSTSVSMSTSTGAAYSTAPAVAFVVGALGIAAAVL